ncbi:unnamed protein product [Candidula unifasciata]|uniref:BHLH domain-containing protein n=1 Tax=Candidula unifasciata TaxID=100452 RepID=A0A8S3YT18_9EUPU|nr:unnamed protein product [Candidula unifasciata]
MALDDRGLSGEQFVELTCKNENLPPFSISATFTDLACKNKSLPPFSSSATFTEPPAYYHHTEYDWQHTQLAQHPVLPHQAHLLESERHFYQDCADESDVSAHGYSTYGHPSATHADFCSTGHGLWPVDNSGEHMAAGQFGQHGLFFSGLDIGQQNMAQQTSGSGSSSGKPKRKRVQSHTQRRAANVRERRRMFHLNEAFDELRKRLPAFNYEKRLSRIETLRLAMTYISFMKEVSVGRDPKCVKLKPHGSELSPMARSGSSMLASPHSSSVNTDDQCHAADDSDCSNDELSNHSGGN